MFVGSSEFYRNKHIRQAALQKVCEDMQIEAFTVDDVKNKIKSMRSTYYLELDIFLEIFVTSVTNSTAFKWLE